MKTTTDDDSADSVPSSNIFFNLFAISTKLNGDREKKELPFDHALKIEIEVKRKEIKREYAC